MSAQCRKLAPLTHYEATVMYLDAVGITGYVEQRNATPFTDVILLPARCCERVWAAQQYCFDLNGHLLWTSGVPA